MASLGCVLALAAACADGEAAELEAAPLVTAAAPPNERLFEKAVPRYEVVKYGESSLGRDLEAEILGDGPVTVVVIGGLHTGLEAETVDIVRELSEYVRLLPGGIPAAVRFVSIASANPDGYFLETRTNANDVDLNRNWPTQDWSPSAIHGDAEVFGGDSPLSEPETASLYDFLRMLEPDLVLSVHGYAGVVQHNMAGNAGRFARVFAGAAGFEATDDWEHYEITGELIEAMADAGIAAADIELFEADPDSFNRVRRGLEAVLQELAAGR